MAMRKMAMRKTRSTALTRNDQDADLNTMDRDLQSAIVSTYVDLDKVLAEFAEAELVNLPGVTIVVDQLGRIIIKLYHNDGTYSTEFFHFSLFTKNNRYGGLHITCPYNGAKLYLPNDEVLFSCGHGSKYLFSNLFDTLIRYFNDQHHSSGEPLSRNISEFVTCSHRGNDKYREEIIELLKKIKIKFENFEPLLKYCEAKSKSERRSHPYRHGHGGSTKLVIYLVKIEKIRELNKKLRKNKTKYKNKIQKNNKQIDELKIKIKKEKAKAKEKLKKEKAKAKEKLKKEKAKAKEKIKKEKAKLKKLKVKKVHITKKIKK